MNTVEYITHKDEEMKITIEWGQCREAIDTDRGTFYQDYYEPVEAQNEEGDIWESGFDYPEGSWQNSFNEELVNNRIEY